MHKTIIGRSGFGKSTYLEHLILATAGGFAFVDPHGQSAERIADTVPCIYWDASEGLVSFNPLANVPPEKHALIAAQVVYAIKAVAGELSWGPRLNWTLYNAVRLALDNNGTVLDIYSILTDKDCRASFLRRASFPEYWDGEFAKYNDRFRDEVIAPVLNKIGMFKANPLLNRALSDSTINFARVMAKGQNLVINLAKSKLGGEPAHLLGALIIAGLYNAAQTRPFDPPVFTLFADEFQNFATQSFSDILSEARKFGLHVVLAHQYLAQVPQDLLPAVFANVGQITAFNVSADDAAFLGKEMDLHPQMLQDLTKFEAWQKTGLATGLVKTIPPSPTTGRLEANRRTTRARYARLDKDERE